MAQTQPALPFVHLVVERFDYERVGGEWGEWAALRLLAGLGTETITPSAAYIVVECDATGDSVYAAATSSSVERRLRTDGPAEFEALWSATFSVPLEVVEAPAALFKLIAGERRPVAVALPVPQLSHIGHPVLSLTELRRRHHETMRRRTIGSARQLAAVATSVAVTATSVPTAALATQLTTPSATPAPTAAPLTTSTPAPTTTTATTTAPATPGPSVAAAASAGAPAPVRQRSSRHSTKLHQKRTHRIASPSTASHRSVTSTTRATSGCATTDTAGPTAYAATGHTATSAHARHVTCHTRPASGPTSPPLGAALSFGTPGSATSTTQNPAPTSTPRPGKPTPTPPSHHPAPGHAAQPAHHGGTHSSSTGGVAPAAPSRPVHSSTPSSSPAPVSALSSTPAGFSGPKSWTGTVAANPALTGAVTELSGLLSNGNRPPSFLIPVYMEAGKRYGVPWEVLASINAIESDYGRNLNTSSAGAVGWMQFEPSTWSQYGMAVDGHSVPNPYDPRDAIFSAARYLAAAGAAQDVPKAVFAYNHASWYVDEVMSRAKAIAGHVQYESSTLRHGVFAVSFATGQKTAPKIRYTSGVLSHYDRLISAANMVSAANFPYVWGGGHTQPSQFAPFDCSGSVSYVIQQAGYTVPTTVSGDIPVWKFPAGPGQVTIFYNPTHTFMRIGDRYFGTSGFARPGGGAGWFSVDKLPADYLAQFREVHVPNLGPDSFSGSEPPVVVTPLLKKHRHRNTTSTVRFWPLMSTLGVFPGASNQA